MTDEYLLVPMHLDAMVLNLKASVATPFMRFQMAYRNLNEFTSPEPRPFAEGSDNQPDAGVYLHWTLPKALRHGTHPEGGNTDFPLVPNRWLVVRFGIYAGAAPVQEVKAWVLESDYLGKDGKSPFVHPHESDAQGGPIPTQLGRARRLTPDLKSLPVQDRPFLTSVGPGSVTFAVFSPGNENVFSFHDQVKQNDDVTEIHEADLIYHVVGWHSDPGHDPLQQSEWQESTASDLKGTYANDTFDWIVYADDAAPPKQALVHALVSGVSWQRDGDNASAPTYPTNIPSTVRVAVGNTAVEALAAIVRLDAGNPAEGDLLEAFHYGLLEHLDEAGSALALNTALRQHWFGASSGGTLWAIVAKERSGDTALPAPPAPVLTDAQVEALADLNVAQHELDRQQRILESMQWDLFALWWKDKWQNQNNPPVSPGLTSWLATQLPLQVGVGSICADAGGSDPDREGWTICKVKAQQNRVAQRTNKVHSATTRVKSLLDPDNQELKATNMPQYHYPNDPVLLVTGLGRSTNYDPPGSPTCRLPSQTVSALTVSGTTYCTDGSCGKDIGAQIPVLEDPNHLLPPGVQQLHTESCFLSPAWFARVILKDKQSAGEVQKAILALPAPAAGARFAPQAGAMQVWEQPWVPLLLDWQVTVFDEPAYTCEEAKPTCTFNRDNWQFQGTDYRWCGPTEATGSNFDEANSQMTLEGRTFVTPQLSFALADQLEQYVQKHKMRNPELEKLLEDLEAYIQELQGKDILSQRLSGMTAMMVERDHRPNVAPFGEIAGALGDFRHGYPLPFGSEHSSDTPAVWDYAPLRGTFFVINKLTVIDAFGRTIDLMLANHSTYDGTDDPERYFYPIAGREVKAPTTIDPKPGQGKSKDPTERMLKLAPRLIQDAQLAFRLIPNDGREGDIYEVAGAHPICGWIVPNHLDRSLALYAPEGAAWGELFLSRRVEGQYAPVWQPDPTNPDAPQSIDKIPNPYLKAMLQALCARSDQGGGFHAFLRTIDETLWTINPLGRRQDQDLSVLIGRPLAVVRAALSLKLRGLPHTVQDWWHTFDVDPAHLPDASRPAALKAVAGGVFDHLWPVRLGSAELRDDGLIGYYQDDPAAPDKTFQVFHTVHLPESASTNYLERIQPGSYPQLRLIDDTVAAPEPKDNQVLHITMLVDPRASVHAFTGLLPVYALDIPSPFTTPALQKMAYTFRAGPFLTSPDAVRVRVPAEHKGTWSWFDKVLDTTVSLSQADGKVRFPTTPPLVKEGWLKFKPNPAQDDK